jgi:uncharacterized protein (DUF983 family)
MPTTSGAHRVPDPLRPPITEPRHRSSVRPPRGHPAAPRFAHRSTDTPLELPTIGRALSLAWRALRLRCPHCGRGAVLTRVGAVRDRCAGCGLRFQRSDDNYFSGAMFFGLMMGEGVFALSLLAIVLLTWPDVPWDALTYAGPIGMIVVMLLLIPVSRVVWLAVDVLVRPVTEAELTGLDTGVNTSADR